MAVGALKTWVAGEILTASDLNAEVLNILQNGEDLGWPATKAKDLNGQVLVVSANGGVTLTADTPELLDLGLAGTDLFGWDGTETTPVNGYNFVASATTVDPSLLLKGSDTNINLDIVPKGTGVLKVDGNEVATILAAEVFS